MIWTQVLNFDIKKRKKNMKREKNLRDRIFSTQAQILCMIHDIERFILNNTLVIKYKIS